MGQASLFSDRVRPRLVRFAAVFPSTCFMVVRTLDDSEWHTSRRHDAARVCCGNTVCAPMLRITKHRLACVSVARPAGTFMSSGVEHCFVDLAVARSRSLEWLYVTDP